ncbi:hypothetical protein [Streptomyces tsukubensis]|uniref:hypothetical protein n=1 Tax=Streptomyces tsukubensis TaxID=83656 RepID=UPI00344B8D81
MTDNDNQPELTPAQQHQQDLARVERQLDVTDVARKVTSIFGGNGFFARTDFEGHELNIMIDMVLNANPADLESAGDNLWNARKALRDAAEELRTNIKDVHWEGTSGEAFRDFGRALADHADQLGTFADIAATQIRVAGTGLASVRSSMPERDTRIIKHNAKTMPLPERIDTNPDFVAAKKVEKNRQEAINQMNRLASFYAVSEQTLAGQEPPKFSRVLKADVPRPRGGRSDAPGAKNTTSATSGTRAASPVYGLPEGVRVAGKVPVDAGSPAPSSPGGNPSMELDSVATPVVAPTAPNSSSPPTSPAPVGQPPVGPVPSQSGQPMPMRPVPNSPGKTISTVTGPLVAKATGGQGVSSQNKVSSGGAPGQAGNYSRQGVVGAGPSATGGASPVGRPTGPMGSGATSSPAGRANPTGASPMAGGQGPVAGRGGVANQAMGNRAGSATAGSRVGRDGVVGGNPQRATGSGGSRLPRGTVVGADGPGPARPTPARPGAAGAVGASPAGGTSRTTTGGTPASNGVVGASRADSAGRSRPGSFTTGGTGLVHGRPGRNPSNREENRSGSGRPDYLAEDDDTWTAQRRHAGPPVIE